MSAPVDPKAAEMWIAGLGMALVEMKDSEITTLRAEVASKNEQFQQYARKMELDMNALAAENERLRAALRNCISLLDGLVAESGRSIEWGEEDPFRMGEWFEPEDLAQIEEARAALEETKHE